MFYLGSEFVEDNDLFSRIRTFADSIFTDGKSSGRLEKEKGMIEACEEKLEKEGKEALLEAILRWLKGKGFFK